MWEDSGDRGTGDRRSIASVYTFKSNASHLGIRLQLGYRISLQLATSPIKTDLPARHMLHVALVVTQGTEGKTKYVCIPKLPKYYVICSEKRDFRDKKNYNL